MATNRSPGYKCPYCPSKFTAPFGFRQGREAHVRTYHRDRWMEFCEARKAGRFGWNDSGRETVGERMDRLESANIAAEAKANR